MPEDPAPFQPEDEPARRRSVQDRRLAERIQTRRDLFTRVRADAEAVALFDRERFGEDRLDAALALCEAAQTGYDDRLNALDAKARASHEYKTQNRATRQAFGDLRGAVLAEYRDDATRRALGVDEEPPDDLEEFLTYALGLLDTLEAEPHATALDARHGYDDARRADVRTAVLALRTADKDHTDAANLAKLTTAKRDEAYDALMAEADLFDRATPRALRDHPDVRTRLGL